MIRLGHYTVLERITEGGMGIVYRAHHRGLQRDYVVKVLNPELAHREKTVKRFLREARSAARLEHPHVVPVVDVGTGVRGVPPLGTARGSRNGLVSRSKRTANGDHGSATDPRGLR